MHRQNSKKLHIGIPGDQNIIVKEQRKKKAIKQLLRFVYQIGEAMEIKGCGSPWHHISQFEILPKKIDIPIATLCLQ